MATSSRFATINKEELQKLIKAKDAESTQRSTEVGVKIFKLYLKERPYDPDFEFTAKLNLPMCLNNSTLKFVKKTGTNTKLDH